MRVSAAVMSKFLDNSPDTPSFTSALHAPTLESGHAREKDGCNSNCLCNNCAKSCVNVLIAEHV